MADTPQTTPRMPTNVWRVACAMHNADEPLCDWAELPHEDTSFGIGKTRRLAHARAALHEIGQVIIIADAIEVGIEAAAETVSNLPMGERKWDKKEYMIAEIAARLAVEDLWERMHE